MPEIDVFAAVASIAAVCQRFGGFGQLTAEFGSVGQYANAIRQHCDKAARRYASSNAVVDNSDSCRLVRAQ
ncbi:MAG: hypothetical protein ABSB15_16540 [Bryobacteraceae bacterium]|jgi:hypothetical protein